MNITLKKANTADIPALLEIQRHAFATLYEQYSDEKSPYLQTEEELEFRITYPDGCYFKILHDGVLCGGIFVYKKEEHHRIGIIYIDPDFQNMKIGQSAISLAFELYPNAKKWELDVPSDQTANIKCYTKMGFGDTGKREKINDKLTLAYFERNV